MSKYNIPILLITFNRPDTSKQVFEKIKELRPTRLYIFSDGPRQSNVTDELEIAETRSVFERIDWECDVRRSYMSTNQGCGRGVSQAIDWVFQHEEMAIILEDDCVPHMSFFSFCREMLYKYIDTPQVMHIAGTRWNEEYNLNDEDYFFSKISHIWGWATWKRAWLQYDYEMKSWKAYKANHTTLKIFKDKRIAKFWDGAFDYVYQQKIKHTWDYQWQYALFANKGLSINPNVNLVSNIGLVGIHASEEKSVNLNKHTKNWRNSSRYPHTIEPMHSYDNYHMLTHFMEPRSFITKMKHVIKMLKVY